jgi:SAM-dependent methyltransferase
MEAKGIHGKDDQRRLWAYYQGEASYVFNGANERLEYLTRHVGRLFAGSVPRVLTVGIGNGYLERACSGRGWPVICLDPDRAALGRLQGERIAGLCGLLQHLPLRNESCDVVIASEVLEHLNDQDRDQGVSEVRRVLRRGGYFIGTVPYRECLADAMVLCPNCGNVFHRWGHQKSFDEKSLHEQLSRHFDRVRVRRTAFVDFRLRSLPAKMKGILQLALAWLGFQRATPNLFFLARSFRP